jgi:hypothetical protein
MKNNKKKQIIMRSNSYIQMRNAEFRTLSGPIKTAQRKIYERGSRINRLYRMDMFAGCVMKQRGYSLKGSLD